MRYVVWLFTTLAMLTCASIALSALLPPMFMNCVVALGSMQPQADLQGQPAKILWKTEGTGFLYGYLVKDDPEPTKREYDVYLVTAKHVVTAHVGDLHVRV